MNRSARRSLRVLEAGTSAATIFLTGCLVSVEPVITEADASFDARLVGSWIDEDGDSAVVSRDGDGPGYSIHYADSDGSKATLNALLGHLGPSLVLDVTPAPGSTEIPGAYASLMIPGHLAFVIALDDGAVFVRQLEVSNVRKAVRAGQADIGPASLGRGEDNVTLLGQTRQLREKLEPLLRRPDLLTDSTVFRRTGGPR